MTAFEINEQLAVLLSENPVQLKQSNRFSIRKISAAKNNRLMRIIRRHYIPHAGYIDYDFDGFTLLHSGKYIKCPKNSNCQRWMKRLTSKRYRHNEELFGKGNQYRRLFDYWWTIY